MIYQYGDVIIDKDNGYDDNKLYDDNDAIPMEEDIASDRV